MIKINKETKMKQQQSLLLKIIYSCLNLCIFLSCLFLTAVHAKPKSGTLEVETYRIHYTSLENALWNYLNKTQSSRDVQLKKIYETHRHFVNQNFLRDFDYKRYENIKYSEWIELQNQLLEVNGLFVFFRNFLNQANETGDYLNERAAMDFCNSILLPNNYNNYNYNNNGDGSKVKKFSIADIFENIERNMITQAIYYRAMIAMTSNEICRTRQSAQLFLYMLYSDIAITELKAYAIYTYSLMILRTYKKGNFTAEAQLMHDNYEKRNQRTLKVLKEVMRRADRTVWRCDPDKYVKGETYDEVTRLLQGHVENEIDMNTEETCRENCGFYEATRSEGCYKDMQCSRQPRCSGKLYHCTYVDSDMWICPSLLNSTRRYEYIEYENGRILGRKTECNRGTTKVDSWWRYLFWHCSYCFCLCDEQGSKSDRYFSLHESVSDVKNNKVVTGLRIVKEKRVFHIQIQEGQLLKRGNVNSSTLEWKPVDSFNIFDKYVRSGRDYHTMSWEKRAIDLDDIHGNEQWVVIGVRFRVVGAHLNLEAKLAEMNYETGELITPMATSYWKSNDNTDNSEERRMQIKLYNPDVPTYTQAKSRPISKHNQYVEFVNTDMDKDVAQTTVPFIDTQEVVSDPPVPLSGIGIYLKGQYGFGGFIAPKIITFDFTHYVQVDRTTT